MLAGKLFPNNFRALRLLTEVLLADSIKAAGSPEELSEHLEDIRTKSRTKKVWVRNVIKPIFRLMLFVRAEHE